MAEQTSKIAGKRFHILRDIHQKTQADMGADLGGKNHHVDPKVIRKWQKEFPLDEIERIVKVFEIESWLLTDSSITDDVFSAYALFRKSNPGKKLKFQDYLKIKSESPERDEKNTINIIKEKAEDLYGQNKYHQAIDEFLKIIDAVPENWEGYYETGRCFYSLGGDYHKDAIDYFTKAIDLIPKDHDFYALSHFYRGRSHKALNEYEAAIADFTEVINVGMDTDVVNVDRIECLINLKKINEAIEDYSLSISKFPFSALVYKSRAEFYLHSGYFDDAIANFTKAIEIETNNVLSFYQRGICYLEKKDYQAAIADFQNAIKVDPNYPYAYDDLALILATCPDKSLRDGEKAVEYAKRAVSAISKPEFIVTLSMAYAEAGLLDRAVETQSQVVEIYRLGKDEKNLEKHTKLLDYYKNHGKL
jgi:tetratricopeptide (TPR) repeat protein